MFLKRFAQRVEDRATQKYDPSVDLSAKTGGRAEPGNSVRLHFNSGFGHHALNFRGRTPRLRFDRMSSRHASVSAERIAKSGDCRVQFHAGLLHVTLLSDSGRSGGVLSP